MVKLFEIALAIVAVTFGFELSKKVFRLNLS